MMDEIEMDRQKALQGWDRQSCAEYEAWLDEIYIRDEEGEKVHFSLTPAQKLILEHHETCAATRGLTCERDCETAIREVHGRRKEF